ncbi:uncharacterized protein LOC131382644 [Hylobates moloch]|uniref:uncharacterized protein LOC131382644 n=1 Tax=Hylobates moloch TaxID=81572 RepID=UPI0026764743|nr:uncharacterized protein LOC131382644 [Hylobates moloch]
MGRERLSHPSMPLCEFSQRLDSTHASQLLSPPETSRDSRSPPAPSPQVSNWEWLGGGVPKTLGFNSPPKPSPTIKTPFVQTAPLALPGKATELLAGVQNPAGSPRLCRNHTHCCWILSPISCEMPVRAFPHPSEAQSLLGPFKDVPLPSPPPHRPPPPTPSLESSGGGSLPPTPPPLLLEFSSDSPRALPASLHSAPLQTPPPACPLSLQLGQPPAPPWRPHRSLPSPLAAPTCIPPSPSPRPCRPPSRLAAPHLLPQMRGPMEGRKGGRLWWEWGGGGSVGTNLPPNPESLPPPRCLHLSHRC